MYFYLCLNLNCVFQFLGGRDCLIPNVRKREELSPRKSLEKASIFLTSAISIFSEVFVAVTVVVV